MKTDGEPLSGQPTKYLSYEKITDTLQRGGYFFMYLMSSLIVISNNKLITESIKSIRFTPFRE